MRSQGLGPSGAHWSHKFGHCVPYGSKVGQDWARVLLAKVEAYDSPPAEIFSAWLPGMRIENSVQQSFAKWKTGA